MMKDTSNKKSNPKSNKPPRDNTKDLVCAGGRIFDLSDEKWEWLEGYDLNTKLYILSTIAKD